MSNYNIPSPSGKIKFRIDKVKYFDHIKGVNGTRFRGIIRLKRKEISIAGETEKGLYLSVVNRVLASN